MVEKIIINPNKVRGYGNIMSPHSSTDYELSDCTITETIDTVNGQTMTVYELEDTILFFDRGTIASHNDNWVKYNPNNFTITRGEEYTSVTGSNYRYGVPISNNCKIKVETRKTTSSTGTLLSIWTYTSNPLSASQLLTFSVTEMGMTQGTFANIEMVVTSSSVTVTNLDNNTTLTKEYSTNYNLEVNFWGTTFDYKNFKIWEG